MRASSTVLGTMWVVEIRRSDSERFGIDVAFPNGHPYSFCVMFVRKGAVHCERFGLRSGTAATGGQLVICQTEPGTQALTTDSGERLNLWINRRTLVRCLEAMLDRPLDAPLTFAPEAAWSRSTAASLKWLLLYVADELTNPYSLSAGSVGVAGLKDLIIQMILECTVHSYSEGLACGASVAGEAFLGGDPDLTVSAVCARFGFSDPARFAAVCRARLGCCRVLPAKGVVE